MVGELLLVEDRKISGLHTLRARMYLNQRQGKKLHFVLISVFAALSPCYDGKQSQLLVYINHDRVVNPTFGAQ